MSAEKPQGANGATSAGSARDVAGIGLRELTHRRAPAKDSGIADEDLDFIKK